MVSECGCNRGVESEERHNNELSEEMGGSISLYYGNKGGCHEGNKTEEDHGNIDLYYVAMFQERRKHTSPEEKIQSCQLDRYVHYQET